VAGGRRSEVKAERRAKPDAGDMSGGGRPPPVASKAFELSLANVMSVGGG
jgi:hypothetical protein